MEESIFKAVQENFNIVDVANELGIRVKKIGSTWRADSIENSGHGENALALYETTNSWYDFMLQVGGDITALVAFVKFDGNIRQALHFLMPDVSFTKFDAEIKAKKEFAERIDFWHKKLFDASFNPGIRALDYLHKRGINDDTIKTLKIGIDMSAGGSFRIAFPYWDESRKNVLYYTTRRFDWRGEGENEHEPKYKKASLDYFPFLRNAPMGLDTLERKKDDTLFITEGVVDFLAFWQEGYSVLSPNGGEFGKLWQEVIEKIKGFKRVVLVFDNDDAGQKFTYEAAKVLMKHRINFSCANLITKDVAEHYAAFHNLDAVVNSVRNGYKWFIDFITPKKPYEDLTYGEREKAENTCKNFIKDICPFNDSADMHSILMALRKYFPKEFISGLFELSRKGLSQDEVKEKIKHSRNLLYNERTGFYEYQAHNSCRANGYWKHIDDTTVQGYIMNVLGRFATGGKLSSILKLVKGDPDINSELPIHTFNTLPLVSFSNGTLHINLETGEAVLKPHRYDDFNTVQLPFAYDKNALCKAWRKFVNEITNGKIDNQYVLQEFVGYILAPHCKFQKALMLKGGGSNGKGVFFNVISAALGGIGQDGRGYVSMSEPAKWNKDFRLMSLRHSWLNISSDTEQDLRGSEGIFKKVVAGETLEDSYKHKDPIPFRTRTKLMMACNYFPTVNDTSDGFMRRWLIVELPMRYVDEENLRPNTNDRVLDPFLEDKLMKELPGIFNWILEGLQRLIKQKKFTKTKEHDRLIREFRSVNNPLYSFVEENEEVFKGSELGHQIERRNIFAVFAQWAELNKIIPMPANRFYSNIKSVFANVGIDYQDKGKIWIFYPDYSKDEKGDSQEE